MGNDKSYHLIGIGGIGMSALAHILLQRGYKVSGSDLVENAQIQALRKVGATIEMGHEQDLLDPNTVVAFSSAIPSCNPELRQAETLGCTTLHRADLLNELIQGKHLLTVAGAHGKTSTSALLAHVLIATNQDPSYCIGGVLKNTHLNGHEGQGPFFVAESDESDGSFLKLHSRGAIITNITAEHLENYRNFEHLKLSFAEFITQVEKSELLVWCGDDPAISSLELTRGLSYGFSQNCDWIISNYTSSPTGVKYDLIHGHRTYKRITLPLFGKHNALNSASVFILALQLGIPEEEIRNAFKSFQGISRRMDVRGNKHNIEIIDDYAHHPTEIKATLLAMRERIREKQLTVIFQPHRYTRLNQNIEGFAEAFKLADQVIVTDIYAASEPDTLKKYTEEDLANLIREKSSVPTVYVPYQDLTSYLISSLNPYDVLATLGAGSITYLGEKILQELSWYEPKQLKIGLIFGGRSCEHPISLRSAQYFLNTLKEMEHAVELFGISQKGSWHIGDEHLIQQFVDGKLKKNPSYGEVIEKIQSCDVLIPVLHGPNGEDGTVQGFLETLQKAYVGCDVLSAATCMDKVLSKKLVSQLGIGIAPYIEFTRHNWLYHSTDLLNKIEQSLQYPLFVKATHLGSSIGVYKVHERQELESCIIECLKYDYKVLVEQGIKGREIEFAILGNEWIDCPMPGEVFAQGQFYDYNEKYNTSSSTSTTPIADLPEEVAEKGIIIAKKIYESLGCQGLARVDFFLTESGDFIFNEINPFPGFTSHSLYPQIWHKSGLESEKLVERLLILAMHRFRKIKALSI